MGITYPSGGTNAFVYNGLDQRVGKADSSGAFSYTLEDDRIDSAVLSDGAASYHHGLGLVSENRGGTSRFYHADALGTTRKLTDGGQSVSDTKESDAFGNVWTPGTSGTNPTPFGFAGQHGYQSDADSGLMRLGYRYYDASTGRFLSRDPIQDGYNWYTYCDNDPVNYVDPSGCIFWFAAVFALVALIAVSDEPAGEFPQYSIPPDQQAGTAINRGNTLVKPYVERVEDCYDNFQQGGDWDHKQDFPPGSDVGDDWGNYEFGAQMSDLGMPQWVADQLGGIDQILKGDPGSGIPFLMPPYGDEWDDYYFVNQGWNAANNGWSR